VTIRHLDFAEPFFKVSLIEDETSYTVAGKAILLNLSSDEIAVERQILRELQSAIFSNIEVKFITKALMVERLNSEEGDDFLFAEIKKRWPSAYEVRNEERLKGIAHYMSPKVWLGQLGLTIYFSGSVPLNVGLHKDHDFCPVPGYREVHTQLVGFGKMQQCRDRDIKTLYLEEPMAPGTTHRPMYDEKGNYPWHQFETITPSVFMAVEMLPKGAVPPEIGLKL